MNLFSSRFIVLPLFTNVHLQIRELVDLKMNLFNSRFIILPLFPTGRSPDYYTNVKFPPKVEHNFQNLNQTKSDFSGHILNRLNFLADVLFGVNVLISQNTSISSSNFPCGS